MNTISEYIALKDVFTSSKNVTIDDITEILNYLGKKTVFIKNNDFIKLRYDAKSNLFVFMNNSIDINQKIITSTLSILKKYSSKKIIAMTKDIANVMNCNYNQIRIKNTKTRWGSCSSLNNLNFNWKLAFAPEDVCKYVIIHELAHTKEHNHSYRFWDIVRQYDPSYKAKEYWLKQNAYELQNLPFLKKI